MRTVVGLVLSFALAGCTSSHMLIGTVRPPTRPALVKIYLEPPAQYERIALVEADGSRSFQIGSQGRRDAALRALKKEAAKVGANGIILEERGENLIKQFTGVAIWVN